LCSVRGTLEGIVLKLPFDVLFINVFNQRPLHEFGGEDSIMPPANTLSLEFPTSVLEKIKALV